MFSDAETFFVIFVSLFFAVLGACLGSFSSAIIYRIPRNISWIFDSSYRMGESRARSCCTSCGHSLGMLDLIPIVSWICSRGRCRYCCARVSATYVFYELTLMGMVVSTWFITADVSVSLFLSVLWAFIFSFVVIFVKYRIISKQLIFVIFALICFILIRVIIGFELA